MSYGNPTTFDDSYQTVPERIALFRDKYPDGSLGCLNDAEPYRIETIGDQSFIVVSAAAYRTPDDQRPGIGLAWCPLPGTDIYTKDSELMNAQTSAWGRAIVAVLAADAKRIATHEEVRVAEAQRSAPQAPAQQAPAQAPSAATANGTAVRQEEAPQSTDPTAELYNAAVVEEALRLMKSPTTTYSELRDVWQVLSQARLGARRIEPPQGMDPDGDGLVPILSAVAFVGKQRKEEAPPVEQPELLIAEAGGAK